MPSNKFKKTERLKSRKEIEQVLEKGKKKKAEFVQMRWLEFSSNQNSFVKVLVTVPKKKFKKAVDRNRLKRRMREAYRLNKGMLINNCEQHNKSINIMFIYQADDQKSYAEIENKIVLLLNGLLPSHETNS